MITPPHIAALRTAAAERPDSADCLCDLGNALLGEGETRESIGCYKQALALRPNFPEVHNNLGVALKRLGQLDEAIASFGRALELRLNYADAHNNLGNVLCVQKKWDAGITCFQRAISLRPDFADAIGNLGNALLAKGDLDRAMICYDRALALRPDSAGSHNNRCNALREKGDLDAAAKECLTALSLRPDFGEAHLSLALMLLVQGDFAQGWREYEWRWKAGESAAAAVRPDPRLDQWRWDGSDLNGRRILLSAEQGLGDTIQFVRYAALVARRGGRVVLACQAPLLSMLRQVEGVDCAVALDQAMPPFDVQCPLLSLPGIFGTTLADIPAAIPYLRADPARSAPWHERLAGDERLKIGLAWAGRPAHRHDLQRSFSAAIYGPLAKIRPARFVSLQKKDGSRRDSVPMPIMDWTDELHDFSDTAALMDCLDLIITADTAVAHLAGAMGKPVWVMMPFFPDWRWLLHRVDSPWYPTMRLIRQPRRGDWDSPIRIVAEMLKTF